MQCPSLGGSAGLQLGENGRSALWALAAGEVLSHTRVTHVLSPPASLS